MGGGGGGEEGKMLSDRTELGSAIVLSEKVPEVVDVSVG